MVFSLACLVASLVKPHRDILYLIAVAALVLSGSPDVRATDPAVTDPAVTGQQPSERRMGGTGVAIDDPNPWYPDHQTAALTTPQWIGEPGVEAVVVFAIDDMRDPAKYEQYLRPILNRLKQIDGRAPVSIMTNQINPEDAQLQSWLAEGLSIECHTADHPCPLLQGGDFDRAAATYQRCVDQMAKIPGNFPVAFRTPCCDSLNTVSPRFFSEIFKQQSPDGHRLQIDSSVFNFFTSANPELPRELVLDADGKDRFLRYLPRSNKFGNNVHDNFVNTITNYPWPYLINGSCWQFPCVAPSDWSAQHLQGVNQQRTVDDWKVALDLTVHQKGVFNLVFHPHGWIKAEQIVELIDHAVAKHGSKVKFLTFREAADRLNDNLLKGRRILEADESLSSFRILDVNLDGFMDVVSGRKGDQWTRVWDPSNTQWHETSFPCSFDGPGEQWGLQPSLPTFGRVNHETICVWPVREELDPNSPPVWPGRIEFAVFRGNEWRNLSIKVESPRDFSSGNWPLLVGNPQWRDVDGDGNDEFLNEYSLLAVTSLLSRTGIVLGEVNLQEGTFVLRDSGLQLAWLPPVESQPDKTLGQASQAWDLQDLNGDHCLDVIYGDARTGGRGIWLWNQQQSGWTDTVFYEREASTQTPLTSAVDVVDTNSRHTGYFFRDGYLCVQNELTSSLPDLIRRVPVQALLEKRSDRLEAEQLPPIPVGAASIDITPLFPVRLTGYGNRTKESEGVARPLHARCLVFGGLPADSHDPSVPVIADVPLTVLVTVDNCAVPMSIVEAVHQRLADRFGIRRERFALSSTHTHSGPWLTDFAPLILTDLPADQLERLKRYEAELTENIVEVVAKAVAARSPGYLHFATSSLNFAMNRRSLQNGQWAGFGEVPDGPTDKQFPMLFATKANGDLVSVFANYACHATTETGEFNQICPDWPGIASQEIEKTYPGCVALIAIGCGADANPSPRGTHELAVQHGKRVADEVTVMLWNMGIGRFTVKPGGAEANGAAPRRIDPRATCRMMRVDLPLGPLPSTEEWEQRAQQPGAHGVHARRFLEMLNRGESVPTTIPEYPVQTWSFGDDLAMVFLGGEVVVDYSIRLNSMFDGSRLWINAYSNDVPCYIASKRLLREGGYEVDSSMIYYGRPTRLAPEAEDIICDTVQKLMPHDFYSESLQQDFPAPKTVEDALKTFKTHPSLRLELVASEPLIHDPVAFDWDPQGRLWVVEMGDYPNGANAEEGKTGGRVQVLEDKDGDGRFDSATTFLQGLNFPNGIAFWRDGVIITAAPDVIYAVDRDGDLRADEQKVLCTGFVEGNQQHRVNGLRWGLDGWLYLANGDSGGEVRRIAGVQKTSNGDNATDETSTGDTGKSELVSIRGRDLRLNPDTGEIQAISGQTQFGRERDDFGHWFGNNNSNPIWQYVIEDRYLQRNPHAAVGSARAEVSFMPGAAPVFPASKTQARFNDFQSANRFTSACSTMIYRDNCLGDDFSGSAFTSEPVHNLVSRLVMKKDGIVYHGRRSESEADSEVLSSTDNWFRPTMIRTGPDGGLYVADMYRQVIEHPEWIPPEYQRKMDLQAGHNQGRIYRLVQNSSCCGTDQEEELRSWFSVPSTKVSVDELVARIQSPNGWWRDTAQRLLIHRRAQSTVPALSELAKRHPLAAVRVQCLWTVAELTEDHESFISLLEDRLSDAHSEVRCCAAQLLERYLGSPEYPIPDGLKSVVESSDSDFVFQVSMSLGESWDPAAGTILAQVLLRSIDEPWIRAAVMSSVNQHNVSEMLATVSEHSSDAAALSAFELLIPQAAAMGHGSAVAGPLHGLLKSLRAPEVVGQPAAWDRTAGMLAGIRKFEGIDTAIRENQEIKLLLTELQKDSIRIAIDPNADAELRTAAVRFSATHDVLEPDDRAALLNLLSLETPVEIQFAAAEALSRVAGSEELTQLFERWRSMSPGIRDRMLSQVMQRQASVMTLLQAIESGVVSPSDIDSARRDQLLSSREDEIRAKAELLFGKNPASTRLSVLEEYRSAQTSLTADAGRGRAVFEKRCAACHKVGDLGKSIGADLTALRDRSAEAMLVAILDPNRAVEAKFLSYTAVTRDGLTLSGMLRSETGNSITLVGSDGKEQIITRSELEELVATNKSLMPEGLEKDLTPQDLADVIEFLRNSGIRWKIFEGNQPDLVTANSEGLVELPATAAEIYGPSLVFEAPHQNIGWWTSRDDYVVWTFDSKVTGHYTVEFEYACDNSTAGGQLKLSTGQRLLTARIPGTGTWDQYNRWTAGELDIHAGRNQLTITATDLPGTALIDIKSVRLIPPKK
ncbi:MAG: neutral/alkaline non-lysosomal ceramidase N-terminal domain-containing protein [Planctomyces sp.]|nr:neutral/alkaline non-lysosomal ceramidase N-terminal domain-containing protein [Planctomyces sp.]